MSKRTGQLASILTALVFIVIFKTTIEENTGQAAASDFVLNQAPMFTSTPTSTFTPAPMRVLWNTTSTQSRTVPSLISIPSPTDTPMPAPIPTSPPPAAEDVPLPAMAGWPVPVQLEIDNTVYQIVITGVCADGTWRVEQSENVASWLAATYIRPIFALTYTEMNERILLNVEPQDIIRVWNDQGKARIFVVSEARLAHIDQTHKILRQDQFGLGIILSGASGEYRWIIDAEELN